MLATPGTRRANLPTAQRLLRELIANPETLVPIERAVALLELSQLDDEFDAGGGKPQLQADAAQRDQRAQAQRQPPAADRDGRERAPAQGAGGCPGQARCRSPTSSAL